MVALSLTVLTGWAGQLSLGQFHVRRSRRPGHRGPGARRDRIFFPALFLAACVTAIAAIMVGTPALRRPGLYLAVTAFAFAVMTASWLLWLDVFLHGGVHAQLPRQIVPVPEALFSHGWSLRARGHYYIVCLIALCARADRRRSPPAQPPRAVDDRGARQRASRRITSRYHLPR